MTKVGGNQIARQKVHREVEHLESASKSDPVLHLMTSLAGYLQDLVLASSWSVLWRGGQAWRTRIDGPALQDVKGEEQEELLAQKLAFCSVTFNFGESQEQDSWDNDGLYKATSLPRGDRPDVDQLQASTLSSYASEAQDVHLQ